MDRAMSRCQPHLSVGSGFAQQEYAMVRDNLDDLRRCFGGVFQRQDPLLSAKLESE
jgi:hypothetical protein